jgi:type IV pilus assembly protein PilM
VTVVDIVPNADGFTLNGFGKVALGNGSSHNRKAAKALNRICRKNGLWAKTVTCLAQGGEIYIRQLNMPPMDREEIINAARYSERDTAPFPVEPASIDAWTEPDKKTSGRVNALVAMLDANGVSRHRKLFRRTYFKQAAISIVPAALASIVNRSGTIDRSLPVPIINIGKSVTGVYVFVDGYIKFLREINIGGDDFTRLLADGFNISKIEADRLKTAFGIPMGEEINEKREGPATGGTVLKKLQPFLDKMAAEFGRSLDYFKNEQRVKKMPVVYLIGSTASLKNLAAYLTASTEYEFKVYNPFDDFIAIKKDELKHTRALGPEITVPLGLALDRGRTINLLPKRFRYSFDRFIARLTSLAVVAVYLFFLAAIKFAGVQYLNRMEASINGFEPVASSLKKEERAATVLVDEIIKVKGEITAVDERMRQFPELKGAGVNWPAMYREIGNLLPSDIALEAINISFNNRKEYAEDGKLYSKQLVVEGKIRGSDKKKLESLRTFLEKVQNSRLFEHASLISTKRDGQKGGGSSMLLFTIAADMRGG